MLVELAELAFNWKHRTKRHISIECDPTRNGIIYTQL